MINILLISIIGYLLIGYFASMLAIVSVRYQLIWPLGILMNLYYTGGIRIGRLKIKLQWPITFR